MRKTTRLRETFGRRRHRRLDAELAKLDTHLSFKAPVIWNDLRRELEPPLPRPGELLPSDPAEAVEAIRERTATMADTQRAALEEFGAERAVELARADPYPLPAPGDREHYFGDDHLAYWVSGLGDALWLEALAARHGVPLAGGLLVDFGSASGRVVRHLALRNPDADAVGFDIEVQAVRWGRAHLPGVPIGLTTIVPALPLRDASVDLVYAGSVFTHIDDFEEATLLELRRVLKPDGIAVITFHPGRIWHEMAGDEDHVVRRIVTGAPHRVDPPGVPASPELFSQPMPGERVVFTALDYPINNTNLIHDHAYVERDWGAAFAVEEIVEHAHGQHQDAAILRARSR